jgi:hypothetical protein
LIQIGNPSINNSLNRTFFSDSESLISISDSGHPITFPKGGGVHPPPGFVLLRSEDGNPLLNENGEYWMVRSDEVEIF